MWPLHLLFLLALTGPQQDSPHAGVLLTGKLKALKTLHDTRYLLTPDRIASSNTCFTMRSYFFRRQDGNAPVPAGMVTCTPASVLQKKQVSPEPRVRFVPLGAQQDEEK